MAWLILWIAVGIISLIVEICTVAFVSLWFTIGAVAAIAVALMGGSVYLQLAIFLVISIGCMLIGRKLWLDKIKPQPSDDLNLDRFIDSTAVVVQTIDNSLSKGVVKIDGQFWRAKSLEKQVIEENQIVVIKRREGNTLFVLSAPEA